MKTKSLPYSRQFIDEDDIEAVVRTLRSDWLTTGPQVEEFEKRFARDVDADYAIACSSGTAALHLLYLANNIGQGDLVIIPAMTFLATANAVRYSGAEVIFSDVDPDTGEVLDTVKFQSKDFMEKVIQNTKMKDRLYNRICEAYIFKYRAGIDGGIDDVVVDEEVINEEG